MRPARHERATTDAPTPGGLVARPTTTAGAPEPADVLDDPRAHHLLALQHRAGNTATIGVLQREAAHVQRQGTSAPPDTCHLVTPLLDAEAYLVASSSIGEHVMERLEAEEQGSDDGESCLAAPSLVVLEGSDFDEAFASYATGMRNPDTGATFTHDTALRFASGHVHAFQDGPRTVIRLSRASPGVTVHETLHRLSGDWALEAGHNVNEGLTEYFTRRVVQEHGLAHSGAYPDQFRAVSELATVVGEQALADAYFHDDITGLFRGLEGIQDPHLAGPTLDPWLEAMRDGEYVVASVILEGHPPPPRGQGPVSMP